MLLSFTGSAQLVICCETSPKTKSKTVQTATGSYRQAGRKCGTCALEGLTVPSRRCIHRNSFHFFFSVLLIGGKRSIDLEFVESYPTMNHRIFESIFVVEQYILGRIPHCSYRDLLCSMMVDCMNNRNLGILKSLMMFLDDLGLAIANPSCEVEALAAQECYMVGFSHSNLTGNQYACECCDGPVSGIVGDPSHANAMEEYWQIFPLFEREQVDHCLAT